MATLSLADLTMDFSQFTTQFNTYLNNNPVWQGQLTTMTSQTLIELNAAIGAFMQARLVRAREDSFSETAQSDDAVRSITQMQGLRLGRKLPADMQVSLTSTVNVTLDPFTQFMASGQYYFNRSQINLVANVPLTVDLNQGQVQTFAMSGLGSPRQTFLSNEDSFTVSDQDVRVFVNDTQLPKSFGTLWNYRDLPAYTDISTSDGRLLVVFGSQQFGTTPQITDTVVVQYVVTQGTDGTSFVLVNKPISVTGMSSISGTVLSNPTGGGDEQPIQTYKNLSSGAFGTYSSAVTKSQYLATIGVYSGIIDSITQAQRDINPLALEWMNVIRISALTSTAWSQDQIRDYLAYLQTVTMYACRFLWQDPIPVPRVVDLTVYCFNSAVLSTIQANCEEALRELFAPRPGLLMTNFYNSDLINACVVAGNGAVSYVIVTNPIDPMIVTAPLSPLLEYEIVVGGGTLTELVYAYSVSTVNTAGEEGTPNNWVFPQVVGHSAADAVLLTWAPLQDIVTYKVWGRKAGAIGLLATIPATSPLTFTDNGSITPAGPPPNMIADVPIRYNSLASLTVNVEFAERQQRLATNTPTRGG
jgi:hypothetical protein